VECQTGPLTGHPNGAIFANGDAFIAGNCSANSFALYTNPANPVIDAAGQFVGAGVNVGSFGIACAYLQSNGNVVANGGFLEATSGLVINGTTVINSAGQWLGGMTINPPIAVNGNIAAASFSMYNNQANPVINAAGAFVGAGIAVGSYGISGAYLQANGNVVATGLLEAAQGLVISGFVGQPVIDSAGAFIGAGVNVGAYGVGCGYLQANGNVVANGGYLEASNGLVIQGVTVVGSNQVWVGNGVQCNANIFGSQFGIEGVAVGTTFTATFLDTGGVPHTLFVRGGIVCAN
jgi:hypothetical protein